MDFRVLGFETKGKIRACPQRKGKWVLDSHMDLGKETLGPCLNYLVSWPALLQNMRQTLILGLESTKEQLWEVILLHLAIPAEFPEISNEKNEQAKTDEPWIQSHYWSIVDTKDLQPHPSHQGLTELSYCTLKTSKFKLWRETERHISLPLYQLVSLRCSSILHWHHLIFTMTVAW